MTSHEQNDVQEGCQSNQTHRSLFSVYYCLTVKYVTESRRNISIHFSHTGLE